MKLAHVVNIFASPAGSDARRIQEITLETLRRAGETAGKDVRVELLSAQFAEDRGVLPDFINPTRDLDRSVQDFVICADKRRLPFIHDILQRAWEATDADFLIYTNLDIAVYPSFYRFVAGAIHGGIDALAINRAQIPRHHGGADILHSMSVDQLLRLRNRSPHHGIDCVLFRREHFPQWKSAEICVGYPPVGQYLLENAEHHSSRFVWFKDAVQTFHIGMDSDETSPWKKLQGNEIWTRNFAQFEATRLYAQDAWARHGFTRWKWAARRVQWMARRFLPPMDSR